jgi:hypothetical protein
MAASCYEDVNPIKLRCAIGRDLCLAPVFNCCVTQENWEILQIFCLCCKCRRFCGVSILLKVQTSSFCRLYWFGFLTSACKFMNSGLSTNEIEILPTKRLTQNYDERKWKNNIRLGRPTKSRKKEQDGVDPKRAVQGPNLKPGTLNWNHCQRKRSPLSQDIKRKIPRQNAWWLGM